MRKTILAAAATVATLIAGAAAAQPYGYTYGRSYDRGGYSYDRYGDGGRYDNGYRYAYRDSDRDGIPDRAEWGQDRDRDGRPDQWDRYDNRRDWRHHRHHHRHYDRWDNGGSYRYDR